MKRRLSVALFALLLPVFARAADIPIPSQAEWAGAKKTVKLANGISLAYVEMGNPEGKPTLLLHGYGDNSRSWKSHFGKRETSQAAGFGNPRHNAKHRAHLLSSIRPSQGRLPSKSIEPRIHSAAGTCMVTMEGMPNPAACLRWSRPAPVVHE